MLGREIHHSFERTWSSSNKEIIKSCPLKWTLFTGDLSSQVGILAVGPSEKEVIFFPMYLSFLTALEFIFL